MHKKGRMSHPTRGLAVGKVKQHEMSIRSLSEKDGLLNCRLRDINITDRWIGATRNLWEIALCLVTRVCCTRPVLEFIVRSVRSNMRVRSVGSETLLHLSSLNISSEAHFPSFVRFVSLCEGVSYR